MVQMEVEKKKENIYDIRVRKKNIPLLMLSWSKNGLDCLTKYANSSGISSGGILELPHNRRNRRRFEYKIMCVDK